MRAMWLLNHGTARSFDLLMLRMLGIHEVFTPKKTPQEINFRGASVDFSADDNLTIPKPDLEILNQADWYRDPGEAAWEIANKHFEILFFMVFDLHLLISVAKNFKGVLIWRTFGLEHTMSYSKIIQSNPSLRINECLAECGERFWMGNAYSHLATPENNFLASRDLFLPLGMHDCTVKDNWTGEQKLIFFVCPDIVHNSYYQQIYNQFIQQFADFAYAIGGSQPLTPPDPNVLGFLPLSQHQKNMREFRLMFYHSTEPYHVHYHPFEAIRAGMPLIFMAGGILDRMGGMEQPGRCKNIQEARLKIKRILDDDWTLIHAIRKNQVRILEHMRPENCLQAWRDGFSKIYAGLEKVKKALQNTSSVKKNKRIAIIVSNSDNAEDYRKAGLLAQKLWKESKHTGSEIEIVLAHENPTVNNFNILSSDSDFLANISQRIFKWTTIDFANAANLLRYVGYSETQLDPSEYVLLDDGIDQFLDCDLWIFIGACRLTRPLLHIRPYIVVLNDAYHRYNRDSQHNDDLSAIHITSNAAQILVTSQFVEQLALQYIGVNPKKLKRVPMLIPSFEAQELLPENSISKNYFLWITSSESHQNHLNSFLALKEYYEMLDGKLDCKIMGLDPEHLDKSKLNHFQPVIELLNSNESLQSKIICLGNYITHSIYRNQTANAAFLWHSSYTSHGMLNLIDAAHLGVPVLAGDYPGMREINNQLKLNFFWTQVDNPKEMARQLKLLEENIAQATLEISKPKTLAQQNIIHLTNNYWEAVSQCL